MKFKKIDLPEEDINEIELNEEIRPMYNKRRDRDYDDFEKYPKPRSNQRYGFSKYSQKPRFENRMYERNRFDNVDSSERQFKWKGSRQEDDTDDFEFKKESSSNEFSSRRDFDERNKSRDPSSFYKKKVSKYSDEF